MILMLAAAASVLAAMPVAAPAFARDGDQGRRAERSERGRPAQAQRGGRERPERGDERGRSSYERQDRERGAAYPVRPRQEQRVQDRRDERPAPPRWDDGRRESVPALGYGDQRRREQEARRYDGPPARSFAPPPTAARRGGYLPDRYRGDVVQDYRRYRLRPPPQGYAWVRVGDGFALVSLQDGRVFDMIQ